MMTLDLLIINFNQKINLVSGMSQLPMSGQSPLLILSLKIYQLKIFLHDLIGGEIRDRTRPGPAIISLGRVTVASHSILQSPLSFLALES